MTYLLLQTFLLLLSSYFLGAFSACLVKRMTTRRAVQAAALAPRVSAPQTRPAAATAAAKPRAIDPVQPKIDILPRPEPKAAPAQTALDTRRFDLALTGPDPNAGMPRKPIVEIRPAILKSPTVASEPVKPKPQPKPAPAPVAPVVAAPAKPAPVAIVTSVPSTVQSQPGGASAGTAAASAAAAAAVAAAKAAAANAAATIAKPVAPAPQPAPAPVAKAPEPPRPAAVTAPVAPPAPAPAAPHPVLGGDDLQRIRAIDADTERRLQAINVRRFDDIARWTPADINRVSQALGLTGRIDREQWIEQAQILAKGGETYYSRNRAAAARGPAQTTAPSQGQAPAPQPAPAAPTAQQTVAAATAAAAASVPKTAGAAPAAPAPSAPQPSVSQPQSAAGAPASALQGLPQGRSVAEMATAAAAAIAAASASVTRGIRPIEPISPMSRANPNISMPAKLSDAIKDKEVKSAPAPSASAAIGTLVAAKVTAPAKPVSPDAGGDDLKRIRGIGVLIEKRLNAAGVTTYNSIANWTSGDIDRISQTLDFKGRIERENWVEQARILSSGGHTEFSRRVDRGDVETSKDPEGA